MKCFFYGKDTKKIDLELEQAAEQTEQAAELSGYELSGKEDPILSEMLMVIDKHFHDHTVTCVCGSQDIALDSADGDLVLKCRRCGRRSQFPPSKEDLIKLMNASEIILGN